MLYDDETPVTKTRPSRMQELDFMKEGRNAEQCVENFVKMSPHIAPNITVPQVFWEISTPRLMCMEFMDGIGITDVKKMKELGIDPKDVSKLVRLLFKIERVVIKILALVKVLHDYDTFCFRGFSVPNIF